MGSKQGRSRVARLALPLIIFAANSMAVVAQSAPAQKKSSPAPVTQASKDREAIRSELVELLRLSPKLNTVIHLIQLNGSGWVGMDEPAL